MNHMRLTLHQIVARIIGYYMLPPVTKIAQKIEFPRILGACRQARLRTAGERFFVSGSQTHVEPVLVRASDMSNFAYVRYCNPGA
jgi:hypothetical protein